MLRPINPADDHGHVRPLDSGVKVRCGGPAFCNRCQREWYEVHGKLHPNTSAITVVSWGELTCDQLILTYLTSKLGKIVITPENVLDVVVGDSLLTTWFVPRNIELTAQVGLHHWDMDCI